MPKYRNKETGVIVETIASVSGCVWEEVLPKNAPSHEEPKTKAKPKPKKEN